MWTGSDQTQASCSLDAVASLKNASEGRSTPLELALVGLLRPGPRDPRVVNRLAGLFSPARAAELEGVNAHMIPMIRRSTNFGVTLSDILLFSPMSRARSAESQPVGAAQGAPLCTYGPRDDQPPALFTAVVRSSCAVPGLDLCGGPGQRCAALPAAVDAVRLAGCLWVHPGLSLSLSLPQTNLLQERRTLLRLAGAAGSVIAAPSHAMIRRALTASTSGSSRTRLMPWLPADWRRPDTNT